MDELFDEKKLRDEIDSIWGYAGPHAQVYHRVQQERDYWRACAAYLASCHAATAEYDGQLSGVSRARKERFAGLCHKAAEMMRLFGYPFPRIEKPEDARERCLSIMQKLRERKS